jgi:hypothetical protein
MAMETINAWVGSCTSRGSCTGRDAVAQGSVQAIQTQLAAISSSRSTGLDLVSGEGDKVTLSIDAQAFALVASSDEVELDEDGIAAQWLALRAGAVERVIQLTVEGKLNRQERREIPKILKTINKMMAQSVQGRLVPMMNKAKKLGGLETIDSLDLSMSMNSRSSWPSKTRAASPMTSMVNPPRHRRFKRNQLPCNSPPRRGP